MAERKPQGPDLDQILREQAAKAEAGGVSDSLQIEGIPTTPEDITVLHGFDHEIQTPSQILERSAMDEIEARIDALFRLTGVWTSVAVEIENPFRVPKKTIVEHIAQTHDRRF